jgi:hypothetical protein
MVVRGTAELSVKNTWDPPNIHFLVIFRPDRGIQLFDFSGLTLSREWPREVAWRILSSAIKIVVYI